MFPKYDHHKRKPMSFQMCLVEVEPSPKDYADLFEVLVHVVIGDGGIRDELEQFANSHHCHVMLLKVICRRHKGPFKIWTKSNNLSFKTKELLWHKYITTTDHWRYCNLSVKTPRREGGRAPQIGIHLWCKRLRCDILKKEKKRMNLLNSKRTLCLLC